MNDRKAIETMAQKLIPEIAAQALEQWDRGEAVFTVEMGGIGPGYEQVIQILVFELIRDALKSGQPVGVVVDGTVGRCDDACLGFSGAQVGAAVGLAKRYVEEGYRAVYEEWRREAPGRSILVSRDWPKPPITK